MNAPRRQRLWMGLLVAVACLALGLAGYLAWLRGREATGLPAWPLLPMPAQEPEITLTPEEAADAEAQLRGVMLEILTGGFQIEKIAKVGREYVIHCRGKDSIMECRVRRATDQDRAK